MSNQKKLRPESLMMSHGYRPELSEGSVKAPLFQTSTFVFESAEQGNAFFEIAYGVREKQEDEKFGLIYSRINNPNLEISEDRLAIWDNTEAAAVFGSGMAAITTTMLTFLKAGDVLLYSSPLYGGSDHFIHDYLKEMGVTSIAFKAGQSQEEIEGMIEASGKADKLAMIYTETPANPNNAMIDIQMCRRIADKYQAKNDKEVTLVVDNTYMGPLWSQPIDHGADLSVYSATKYIGGHSDLVAGSIAGPAEYVNRVKVLRTFFGNMASPHTSWLMSRSLETLKVRMEAQALGASKIADFLNNHPKVEKVYYLGLIDESDPQYELYKRQYSSPGAMISFDIKGGKKEAFTFLNNLKLMHLAVSLGSTESLVQHPASMTHIAVDNDHKLEIGITDKLVRMSVGVENADDLIDDISAALDAVQI